MKTVTLILRLLFGLVFVVFGANGFLHFIPNMAMPQPAISYFVAMSATGYALPLLFATQVVAGAFILSGVLAPLGLVIVTPVLVNIVLFHTYLAPDGLPLALVLAIIWAFLVWRNWAAFAPLFGMGSSAATA